MAETCGTCGRDLSQPAVEPHREDIESSLLERVQVLASDPLRRRVAFCISVALVLAWSAWDTRPRRRGVALVSGPAVVAAAPRVGPKPFGPPWPPTQEDWLREFAQSSWTYPLPGPARHPAVSCSRLFDPRADCNGGRCAADFATQVWGEHVFAVHDGVVDRVVRSGNEEHGGVYVRVSHWSGMVYTQYFHLAAVARGVLPGVQVKRGDVIGLVGDTGVKDSGVQLHFTLSVRPSFEYPEVYMDPLPLIARWPVDTERQGGVVGLISSAAQAADHSHLLQPLARRHPRPTRKKSPAAADPAESESTSSPD